MVVNSPDVPVQAQIIFVIEVTASNGAYISELKTNYIIPTLEYFHGGALDDGAGNGSEYGVVAYHSADCLPAPPVDTYGPFTAPQEVLDTIDTLEYVGGHSESRACVIEALATAQACLEELAADRPDVHPHLLLLGCSPPYSAYGGGLVPPGCPATMELAARALLERGVLVSVAAARQLAALPALYEQCGGDLHQAQQRNYAKDPRHMVLLRGYSLKERPPSPAPPPAPELQPDVYGQGRGAGVGVVGPPVARVGVGVGVGGVGAQQQGQQFARACGRGWLAPPRQPPLYGTNSALLTQLTQPSYPPPPPQSAQVGMNRMPGMMGAGVGVGGVGVGAPPSQQQQQQAPQRNYIWSGVLEWMEKGKTPGEQQKVTKILPCQVSASSKDIEPELKVDTWPSKLLMQLMPKMLVSTIGGQYLKDSKSVLFHMQPNEALDALTKVMINGFAGCVHFSPMSSPPQCEIKVLMLLYTPDKKAFLGFIPNNQAAFVDRLKKVIQQQKITQIMNKQLPAAAGGAPPMQGGMPPGGMPPGGMPPGGMPPGGSMPGSSGMQGGGMQGGGMQPAVGGVGQMPGPGQGMVQQSMQQHPQQQGMMMSGAMGPQVGVGVGMGGGKGPRPVPQLDGLEAARQQNLEKIQHLQQTLEAAQQQEAQFKSQMDIMSHLQAAQQQEQHYKQLEEQRKQLQLQQQLQQQLRGAAQGGGGGGGGGGGHAPRMMRPILPSNPGLRHLLQQQPQYRPGGGAPRAASQPQQFDDMNNYNEFL